MSMSGRTETGDQQNHKAQKRTQEDIEENCDVFQAGNGKRKQSETVAESRQSPRHAGATAARDRHSCICRCELRQEVEKLKAEKYRLEIQLLKRTLDSDIGDSGTGEE
ncbi:uncharacterized protein LOC128559132 [Mercenaria mercenaria]|uniref:uncharacterized protein LOC128559132 n=1 Tax=Mercenaria mercenaria TaxID=6596 RepID=UPI00234E7436|nr:uncharacterized protein LOC128559132 [Mercenaria mercenaria]